MSDSSRNYIFNRRGTGISDLSAVTLAGGELDYTQAMKAGLYKINSSHQVGIATATEVGLSSDRFPIRVIIVADPTADVGGTSVITCRYWKVVNSANQMLTFRRKALTSDVAIANLYKMFPDFDNDMWTTWRTLVGHTYTTELDAAVTAKAEELYNVMNLTNASTEVLAQGAAAYAAILELCKAANRVPYFKVEDNVFVKGEPAGKRYAAIGSVKPASIALIEAALCAQINHARLKARYPTVADGLITLCSYSLASTFRFGMFETFEHREYFTVKVTQQAASPTNYTIHSVEAPRGMDPPTDLQVGTVYDITKIRLSAPMVERGNMLMVTSGMMHYLFNHTTGGNVATGVLLTILSQSNLMSRAMPMDEQQSATNVLYECLHPVNKRAIANLFMHKSKVYTHARNDHAPSIEQFHLDSFAMIRTNSYPAGSHKAFICLTALKRVLEAGLGPFLPWAEQLDSCITMCRGILSAGARGHIGSNYYTGEPAQIQSSSIDQYLPELAAYLQTFNKGDSLTMSPHMAMDVATKAGMNWVNMLKDLKAKDVSATSAEVVRAFLAESSAVHFRFDPDDKTTWAQTVEDQRNALRSIASQFA